MNPGLARGVASGRIPDRIGGLPPLGLATVVATGILFSVFIAVQPFRYSVAAVAGAAVFLVTLVRPEVGLALIFFSVPFGDLAQITVGGFALTATEPLIAIVAFGWLVKASADRQGTLRLPWFSIPLLGYLAALALAMAVAYSVRLGAKEMIKWIEAVVLFVLVVNIVRRPGQVVLLVGALFAATTLAALQGWYQFFLRQGPEGFLIAGRFLRAYGTFGQPNPYAGFLNLCLPIIAAVLLVGITRRRGGNVWSLSGPLLIALGAGVIIGAAEVMSLSRAAWFGLIAASLAIMAFRSRTTFLLLLVALVLGLLVALLGALNLLPATLIERVAVLGDYFRIFDINEVELTPENWSIVERMATWQSAWDMYQFSPWYGVGPGSFQSLWRDYAPIDWVLRSAPPPHAHNWYLNVLAESGIVGLTGYLVLLVSTFAYTVRCIRRAQRAERQRLEQSTIHPWADPLALALGGLGVVLALSVHNLFDNNFVHGMTAQFGLTLGLIESAYVAADRTEHPD